MTLDQAIQDMLLNFTDHDLHELAWLAREKREATIAMHRVAYNWTIEQGEEFLDNAILAYELLVRENAA